jgi:hypothetical protein
MGSSKGQQQVGMQRLFMFAFLSCFVWLRQGQRTRMWLRSLVALLWCALPLAGAQAHAGASVLAITAITLESNCSGCTDGYTLRLQREGGAWLTRVGHARLGTQDQRLHGVFAAADFEALARVVVATGFVAMQDSYEDPQTRDGSWAMFSVETAGSVKKVFSREGLGPAALQTLRAAIEALKVQIAFSPIP